MTFVFCVACGISFCAKEKIAFDARRGSDARGLYFIQTNTVVSVLRVVLLRGTESP